MKHIVLVKFKEGFFTDEVYRALKEAYEALAQAMPGDILSVRVDKNCVKRERNMDIMVEMELASPETLTRYLSHPIHVKIGETMNCHVAERCSFDRE